jgi:hypothetical protein
MIQMNSNTEWAGLDCKAGKRDVVLVLAVSGNRIWNDTAVYLFRGTYDEMLMGPMFLHSETVRTGKHYMDFQKKVRAVVNEFKRADYENIHGKAYKGDPDPFKKCAEKLSVLINASASGVAWPNEGSFVVRFVSDPDVRRPEDFDVGIEYLASTSDNPIMIYAYDKDGDRRRRPKSEFEFVRMIGKSGIIRV